MSTEENNYRRIEDLPLAIRVEELMPVLSINIPYPRSMTNENRDHDN